MTTLTDKFTTLEEQLATQNATIAGYIDTVETKLQGMLDSQDLIIENMAANTRYLLSAIQANSPCIPCPTPSITVPPVSTVPITIDTDACKRSQAILQMLTATAEALDNLMNLNVTAAWTLISDVYSQIIATLGASDTIPLPSFPEAVNIAGNYFNFAASRLFSGETLAGNLSPLFFDLRNAIYAAGNPSAAQEAYNSIIDGSSMSGAGKLMLKSMAYSALWSYFLDETSEPDLSGFDGSVCPLPDLTCFEFTAVAWTSDFPASGYAITGNFGTFVCQTTLSTSSGTVTHSEPIIYAGDLNSWTWEVLTGGPVYLQWRGEGPDVPFGLDTAGPYATTDGMSAPYTEGTGTFTFFSANPFTFRLCSPEGS
jgi:uncharacterized coiled-coil protein SlyX